MSIIDDLNKIDDIIESGESPITPIKIDDNLFTVHSTRRYDPDLFQEILDYYHDNEYLGG